MLMSRIFIAVLAIAFLWQTRTFIWSAEDWKSLGPEGGYFLGTVTDASDPSRLTAITGDPAEAFRSQDGGKSWASLGQFYTSSLRDVCFVDDARMYAITSYRCYRSMDSGESWQYSNLPSGQGYGHQIAVDPTNASNVYIAGYKYTYDGEKYIYNFAFFKSDNGGLSFSALSTFTYDALYIYDLTVSEANPNEIYAAGYQGSGMVRRGVLLYSNNGGELWTDISDRVDNQSSSYYYCVAVDPTDASRVYVSGSYFYYSANGGASFNRVSGAAYAYIMRIDPNNPACIWLGGNMSVSRSVNYGLNWKVFSNVVGGRCYGVEINDPTICFSTNQGLFISVDDGLNWEPSFKGVCHTTIPALALAPSQPTTLFIENDGHGVMSSHDRGERWEDKGYFVDCAAIDRFLIHPDNPKHILAVKGPG
jgi:photosystem II stability/assembly factor-like uncharacterized protein